jgi:hypothetical protein
MTFLAVFRVREAISASQLFAAKSSSPVIAGRNGAG